MFHEQGFTRIRAIDRKPLPEWYQRVPGVESLSLDLSDYDNCVRAVQGAAEVYNLAADMGGMGFIETHKAECMLSVLVSTHMLVAAKEAGVPRFFYSSSACVYNGDKQTEANVTALKEADAYPALPEDGYGWEKLFSERMARHYREDYGMATRVARYHNVYGPEGTYDGGREKAPAAMCRKVIEAKLSGKHEIEIWGDGEQTRSFLFIDQCLEATIRLMRSDVSGPVNIGSERMISINGLVDLVSAFEGKKLIKRHIDGPTGVRGRCSDNRLIAEQLGWKPAENLEHGLTVTYDWISAQLNVGLRQLQNSDR